MNRTLSRLLALIVPAGFALSLLSASSAGQEIRTRIIPPRTMVQPYTEEVRITRNSTSADGSTDTQQTDQLTAQDSQGRSLLAVTQLSNHASGYLVDDPVAGTRTVWNSEGRQARMLIYPTAVPGRESCWRIKLGDQNVGRGEPQFGMFWTKCRPAGEHQTRYCQERGKAVQPAPDDSPEVKFTDRECLQIINSTTIPGKISEKDEDLGVETIDGFQAQGCRVTTIAADGEHSSEYWLTRIGTARRSLGLPLRSVDKYPGLAKETIETAREVTQLILAEPDPAIFLAPKDYEVKPVLMHEVPCGTASNLTVDAADSH